MDDFEFGGVAYDERDTYEAVASDYPEAVSADSRPAIGVHLTVVPAPESGSALRKNIDTFGNILASTVEFSANAAAGVAYAGYAATANTVKFVGYAASVVPHMVVGIDTEQPDYRSLALHSK